MQDKEQHFSPIKQRILQFIGELGISKREFYSKTGISRGTLESNSGITEEIVSRFLSVYQNISPEWLLTGNGTMEKVSESEWKNNFSILLSSNHTNEDPSLGDTSNKDQGKYTPTIPLSEAISYLMEQLNTKEEKIEKQSKEIGRLEFQIETLVMEIDRLKKQSKESENCQEESTNPPPKTITPTSH